MAALTISFQTGGLGKIVGDLCLRCFYTQQRTLPLLLRSRTEGENTRLKLTQLKTFINKPNYRKREKIPYKRDNIKTIMRFLCEVYMSMFMSMFMSISMSVSISMSIPKHEKKLELGVQGLKFKPRL